VTQWVLVAVAAPALFRDLGPDVVGLALESYDPDAYDGRGDAAFTGDPAKAKRFPDSRAAMTEWTRQSVVRPLREDGKPNRPLTAFTVSPMPMDEWVA